MPNIPLFNAFLVSVPLNTRQIFFVYSNGIIITLTRRVVSVGLAEKLYIHTEAGGWVEIKRSFCGLTLEGWGLLDTAEALYIAPEWWIANGTDDENGGNENV